MVKILPGVTEEGSVQPDSGPDYRKANEEACGQWVRVVDPTSGKFRRIPHLCKKWRKCAHCLQHYAVRKVFRRLEVYGRTHLNVTFMTNKEWRKYSKKHRDKSLYLRIPNENDECMILFDDTVPIGNSVLVEEIKTWNWGEILLGIPEGDRKTGDLGKSEPFFEASIVSYKMVYKNESEFEHEEFSKLIRKAEKDAILATALENPKTPQEVEKAIRNRMSAYTTALRGSKIECFVLPYTATITFISKIDWFSNVMDVIVDNRLQGWQLVKAELDEKHRKHLAENPNRPIYD